MKCFFQISLRNFGQKQKILAENQKNIHENSEANIDQSAMCYISMDSFQRALRSNGKLFFSNLGVIFRISYNFFKNNCGVGFMQARWGEGFVLNSTRSSY